MVLTMRIDIGSPRSSRKRAKLSHLSILNYYEGKQKEQSITLIIEVKKAS